LLETGVEFIALSRQSVGFNSGHLLFNGLLYNPTAARKTMLPNKPVKFQQQPLVQGNCHFCDAHKHLLISVLQYIIPRLSGNPIFLATSLRANGAISAVGCRRWLADIIRSPIQSYQFIKQLCSHVFSNPNLGVVNQASQVISQLRTGPYNRVSFIQFFMACFVTKVNFAILK